MTVTPKNWVNVPSLTTPLDDVALENLERRAGSYIDDGGWGPGAFAYEDFRVKQRGAGANMSVDVGQASLRQRAYVLDLAGLDSAYQYEYNGAQLNVVIATADATTPRIDQVYLRQPTAVDVFTPTVAVVTGTATGGATLDNRTGVGALPTGAVLLADVLVGAGVATIVTANIRNRRSFAVMGTVPQPDVTGSSPRDEVALRPVVGLPGVSAQTITAGTHDNMQSAAAMRLDRRIVGATRIRWRYAQGGTANAANYNIAIVDGAGRGILAAGAVAFAGALNTIQEVALTISATTFEIGVYYVWMGLAPMTGASTVIYNGVPLTIGAGGPGPVTRQLGLRSATGSTTFPAASTILGMTDVASLGVATTSLPVPLISLSVG